MCQMWERICYGSRWNPELLLKLTVRALNLKDVNSIHISLDPFYKDNVALTEFWYQLSQPAVRATNSKLVLRSEVRNDGRPPFFVADLADERKIVFQTEGMRATDVIMRFNRLLGNPEMKGMEGEVAPD